MNVIYVSFSVLKIDELRNLFCKNATLFSKGEKSIK